MAKFSSLNITGYNKDQLPNLFLRQEQPAEHLALVLPGLGYNADMPLLYYSSRLLLERKCDVLQLRPDYQGRTFQAASHEERLERMYEDAAAGLQAGLDQGPYKKLVLVGKSIGTLGMALLINEFKNLGSPVTIWITPLLREVLVVDAALACAAPAFFMVGTADSTFDPAALVHIQKKTGAQAWKAENANHSLELPQDPLAFLDLLRKGMEVLSAFLDQAL